MEEKVIKFVTVTFPGVRGQKFKRVSGEHKVEALPAQFKLLLHSQNRSRKRYRVTVEENDVYLHSETEVTTGTPWQMVPVLIALLAMIGGLVQKAYNHYIHYKYHQLPETYLPHILAAIILATVVFPFASYRLYFYQFYDSRADFFEETQSSLWRLLCFQPSTAVYLPLLRKDPAQVEVPANVTFIITDIATSRRQNVTCAMKFSWFNAFEYLRMKYPLIDAARTRAKTITVYIIGFFGVGKSTFVNVLASLTGKKSPFLVSTMEMHGTRILRYFPFLRQGLRVLVGDTMGLSKDFSVRKLKYLVSGHWKDGERNFREPDDGQLARDASTRAAHYILHVVAMPSLVERERKEVKGNEVPNRMEDDRIAYAALCQERQLNLGVGLSMINENYPEVLQMTDEEKLRWVEKTLPKTKEYEKLQEIYGRGVSIFPLFQHPPNSKSYAVDVLAFRFLNEALDYASVYIENNIDPTK